MVCAKCGEHVGICTCPDIDRRLRELGKSEYFLTMWCHTCNKHYSRCLCSNPDNWSTEVPDDG